VAAIVGKGRSATAARIRRGIEQLRSALRRRGIGFDVALLASIIAAPSAEAKESALVARIVESASSRASAVTGAPLASASAALRATSSLGAKNATIACAVALVLVSGIVAASWQTFPRTTPAPERSGLGTRVEVAREPSVDPSERSSVSEPAKLGGASVHKSEPHPSRSTDRGALAVRAVDSEGEPISGAFISIEREDTDRAWIDAREPLAERAGADGALVVTDLEPGRYSLYATSARCSLKGPTWVDIGGGEILEATLVLEPHPYLTGRAFLFDRSQPLRHSTIEVVNLSSRMNSIVPTDAQGRFVLGPVSSGGFVQLRHESFRIVTVQLEDPLQEEVDVVFLPGVTIVAEVRSPDGTPVKATDVVFQRANSPYEESIGGRTDSAGMLEIRGLEPGAYLVRVEVVGSHLFNDRHEEMVPDVPLHPMSFVLDVVPELTIRALDESGRPVSGARLGVRTERQRAAGGRSVVTDSEGSVKLPNVLRDTQVTVVDEDPRYSSEPVMRESLEDERPIVIVLSPYPRAGGVVIDPDGRPVSGASVVAEVGGNGVPWRPVQHTTTRADGRFELLLVPAAYRFRATFQDLVTAALDAEVREDDEPTDLVLRIDPARTFRMQVLDHVGQAVDAKVVLRSARSAEEPSAEAELVEGHTDAMGWCIVPLDPGEYEARVEANQETIVVEGTVRPGGAPVVVELPPPLESPPLVRGVVLLDGREVSASVLCLSSSGGTRLASSRTDENGRFTFERIDHSRAVPVVFCAPSSEFFIAYSDPMRLVDGETVEVRLSALPGEDLVARVVDEHGNVVPRARVAIEPVDIPAIRQSCRSDAAGRVRVPRLPSWTYSISISSADEVRRGVHELAWPLVGSPQDDAAAIVWLIQPKS